LEAETVLKMLRGSDLKKQIRSTGGRIGKGTRANPQE
jgi:hypothetical protein